VYKVVAMAENALIHLTAVNDTADKTSSSLGGWASFWLPECC